ncbi:aminoglycoside adenylyltransferase domain-containing protein [Streptomyces avermitilis]|uniref:aminoglycoside adenylyltransferase domain-containing protein n=1 Tax=Streptomyces avermitilis TaxID=33903 RepID=UPI0037F83CC4
MLTFARIWTTLATDQIKSKAAADWALTLLPPEHRPALEHVRQLLSQLPLLRGKLE